MKKNKTECDLQSCMFCRLCLKEWLPAVEANRHTFELKKGQVLFEEEQPLEGMYFVYKGMLKVHKKWGEKELIIRFASKGDIVGHRGLGNELEYPVSATALEPSLVCYVDMDFFNASLKVNPDFLYKLMLFFAEELKISERRMRNLAHMPVKGRVANALLSLQGRFGVTDQGAINVVLSRQDIAAYAGTTYETVFRVLSDLEERGYLATSDKEIRLLKPDALLMVVNEGNKSPKE